MAKSSIFPIGSSSISSVSRSQIRSRLSRKAQEYLAALRADDDDENNDGGYNSDRNDDSDFDALSPDPEERGDNTSRMAIGGSVGRKSTFINQPSFRDGAPRITVEDSVETRLFPLPQNMDSLAHVITYTVCYFLLFYGVSELIDDFQRRGLWSGNNGRMVSLCDSLESIYQYRLLTPSRTTQLVREHNPNGGIRVRLKSFSDDKGHYYFNRQGNTDGKQLCILMIAWVIKFIPGTAVSLILSETPVWLKGPRHMSSFALAFSMLQFWPIDGVFDFMRHSTETKTLVFISCALYKLRKIVFSVMHPGIADNQWILKILVAFIVCEGGSTFRRLESWRSGGCLQSKMSSALSPYKACGNFCWAIKQFGPTLLAIVLVGAGQKCWLCYGTSWTDTSGKGWTPIPLKVNSVRAVITNLQTVGDTPSLAEAALFCFNYALEYLAHPLAFLFLVYRYMRNFESKNFKLASWALNFCLGTCKSKVAATSTPVREAQETAPKMFASTHTGCASEQCEDRPHHA